MTSPIIKSSASPFIRNKYEVAHYWGKIGTRAIIPYPAKYLGNMLVKGRETFQMVSIATPYDGSAVIWVRVKDTLDGYVRVFRFDLSEDQGQDFEGHNPYTSGRHAPRFSCIGTQVLSADYIEDNGFYAIPSFYFNQIARHEQHGSECRAFLRVLRQKYTALGAPPSLAKTQLWRPDFLAWGDPNAEADTPMASSASPFITTAKQHAAYWSAAAKPVDSGAAAYIRVGGYGLQLANVQLRRKHNSDLILAHFLIRQPINDNLAFLFDPRQDRGHDFGENGDDDMMGKPIEETLTKLNKAGIQILVKGVSSRLVNNAVRSHAEARSYVRKLAGDRPKKTGQPLIRGDKVTESRDMPSDESESDEEAESSDARDMRVLSQGRSRVLMTTTKTKTTKTKKVSSGSGSETSSVVFLGERKTSPWQGDNDDGDSAELEMGSILDMDE